MIFSKISIQACHFSSICRSFVLHILLHFIVCVNDHNARTVWMHIHKQMKTCAHTISCCVYNGNIQLLSHTHIHTLTHTHRWSKSSLGNSRLTLETSSLTNTNKHMCVNTLSMTTTLTTPNTRNVP